MPLASRRIAALVCLVAALAGAIVVASPSAHAEDPHNKGLYITPIRKYTTLNAGANLDQSVTVGNFTKDPMTIRFSVKQFSVADYSYAFQFSEGSNDWVNFVPEQLTLKPNESKKVPYRINVPPGAKPGGQYYTLFATGAGKSGNATQQIQATSLLYLTVAGQLVHSGGLSKSSIDHLVWSGGIPFTLDITNTGNVHYFAYVSSDLRGLFTKKSSSTATHLLLPGTTRRLQSSIPLPLLPGLYRATYGYKTEFQPTVTRVSRIIYLPPWSIASFIVLAWIAWVVFRQVRKIRARRRHQQTVAARGSNG